MQKIFLTLGLAALLCSCGNNNQPATTESTAAAADSAVQTASVKPRIVSINGTATEILCGLGLQPNIVAVDVTSTYPEAMQQLPKTGHNRKMTAETILSFNPDIVVGVQDMINPELYAQLTQAGVKVYALNLDYSVEGGKQLIRQLADSFDKEDKGNEMIAAIDKDLAAVPRPNGKPNVLFIYARGAGTLMVGGNHTAPATMIELAGGKNAAASFEDFKPLTAEALVKANPDAILMFGDGLQSLGGIEGLEKINGIKETKAGKNKKVIEMDGLLLTGFGPRTGKALAELSTKLNEISIH